MRKSFYHRAASITHRINAKRPFYKHTTMKRIIRLMKKGKVR